MIINYLSHYTKKIDNKDFIVFKLLCNEGSKDIIILVYKTLNNSRIDFAESLSRLDDISNYCGFTVKKDVPSLTLEI